MRDLSVLIAARNEMFLKRTVDDILKNRWADTEIIVVLDGAWSNPPLDDHPDVTVIYHSKSIGQRAAVNEAARLSKAKFIMKLDAHCTVDEGFDAKLIKDCKYDWTMVPRMYNLHVFDWVCIKCKYRQYQGPTPEKCVKCSGKMEKEMIWMPRISRKTDFMRFDSELHFQYWGAFEKREEAKADIAPLMSCVGAGWFLHRQRYWDIDGMDENHGSWGQMGTELACKSWLSGGMMVVNKKTWFAHLFRTQGGDFGFPYPNSKKFTDKAREYSKDFWRNNKWPKAKHPLSWLIKRFAPIPGWPEGDRIDKGMVYYTDNKLGCKVAKICQRHLAKQKLPIISVSLKPMKFGDQNIHLPLERGYYAMFQQILAGLKALKTEIAFLIDHDVLYHPTHFDFYPSKKDVYYYNRNVWRVRVSDGFSLHYHFYSGCCAYRDLLIAHYEARLKKIEGMIGRGEHIHWRRMGFEAGTHNREDRIDDYKAEWWSSKYPNIDIRHGGNLTSSRWTKEEFRSQRNCQGWEESTVEKIPGWDNLPSIIKRLK